MKWIKAVAGYLFAVGCLYFILAYVGDFSTRQSILLSLLIVSLCFASTTLSSPRPRFSPYYVWVRPHWPKLLADFKLIDKPDGWAAIQELVENLPTTSVLRGGIYFTVIQQTGVLNALIYLNHHRSFVTEFDFAGTMQPVMCDPNYPRKTAGLLKSDVWFFMRYGVEGLNLGVEVPVTWWNVVKSACPKPMHQEEGDAGDCTAKLILATIPYSEINLYWKIADNTESVQDWWRKREQGLSKLGWKALQNEDAHTIEHEYFTVSHDAI